MTDGEEDPRTANSGTATGSGGTQGPPAGYPNRHHRRVVLGYRVRPPSGRVTCALAATG